MVRLQSDIMPPADSAVGSRDSSDASVVAPVFLGPEILLESVTALAADVSARAAEIEEIRRLPADLYERIVQTGVFKMVVPRAEGGAEFRLPDVIPIIEAFGKMDGSTAWTVMLGAEIHIIWMRFDAGFRREVFANAANVMSRGAFNPKGRITATDGGYRIDGIWPLASGSYPTDWFFVAGIVTDDRGKPVPNAHGTIDLRLVALRAEQVEVLDTWRALGLRSTESHDIRITNRFVPESHTASMSVVADDAGPMGRLPLYSALGCFHAAVVLGILRSMLDELATAASSKRPVLNPTQRLTESPLFQQRFAALEIRFAALRALLMQEAEVLWAIGCGREPVPPIASGRFRSVVAHIHQEGLEIANLVVSDSGTSVLYDGSSMQRRFRDIRSVCQHVVAGTDIFQPFGALLLGESTEMAARL